MIKKYSLLAFCTLVAVGTFIIPNYTSAATLTTTADGGTVTNGTVDTATYFKFQASPQVGMIGSTTDEAFVVGAAHSGSFDKVNGNAYAMSSAASGIYYLTLKKVTIGEGKTVADAIPALPAAGTEDVSGKLGDYLIEGTTP